MLRCVGEKLDSPRAVDRAVCVIALALEAGSLLGHPGHPEEHLASLDRYRSPRICVIARCACSGRAERPTGHTALRERATFGAGRTEDVPVEDIPASRFRFPPQSYPRRGADDDRTEPYVLDRPPRGTAPGYARHALSRDPLTHMTPASMRAAARMLGSAWAVLGSNQ